MMIRKYLPPFVMWLVFEVIAVTLWFALDNIFFLFNFSYIGTAIAVGLVLYGKKKKYARNVVQFAVGLYMIVYLGFLCRENMQIEGFWYYLSSVYLKPLQFIMLLQKYLVLCYLGVGGVVMLVGQQWF